MSTTSTEVPLNSLRLTSLPHEIICMIVKYLITIEHKTDKWSLALFYTDEDDLADNLPCEEERLIAHRHLPFSDIALTCRALCSVARDLQSSTFDGCLYTTDVEFLHPSHPWSHWFSRVESVYFFGENPWEPRATSTTPPQPSTSTLNIPPNLFNNVNTITLTIHKDKVSPEFDERRNIGATVSLAAMLATRTKAKEINSHLNALLPTLGLPACHQAAIPFPPDRPNLAIRVRFLEHQCDRWCVNQRHETLACELHLLPEGKGKVISLAVCYPRKHLMIFQPILDPRLRFSVEQFGSRTVAAAGGMKTFAQVPKGQRWLLMPVAMMSRVPVWGEG